MEGNRSLSFTRNTVRPCNSRAAPAGKKDRERWRKVVMLWAPAAGSDWIHQHEDGKPRRSEGHGSQRVQNKAMKYIYKQHTKHGNPQRRPPLQQQQCPGWGILYMCHRKLQSQPTGDTATTHGDHNRSKGGKQTPRPIQGNAGAPPPPRRPTEPTKAVPRATTKNPSASRLRATTTTINMPRSCQTHSSVDFGEANPRLSRVLRP